MSNVLKADSFLFTLEKPQLILEEEAIDENVEEILAEAKQEAERTIAKAEKTAQEITAACQKELEEAKNQVKLLQENAQREGYEKGYSMGLEEGIIEVRNKMQQSLQEADYIIEKAYAEKKNILQDSGREIVDLAIKIAEKIINDKITTDKEYLEKLYLGLLNLVKNSKEIILKVSSEDYEYLQNNFSQLQSMVISSQLEIQVDTNLKSGDAIIYSDTGIVSAKIDERLELVKKALLEGRFHA